MIIIITNCKWTWVSKTVYNDRQQQSYVLEGFSFPPTLSRSQVPAIHNLTNSWSREVKEMPQMLHAISFKKKESLESVSIKRFRNGAPNHHLLMVILYFTNESSTSLNNFALPKGWNLIHKRDFFWVRLFVYPIICEAIGTQGCGLFHRPFGWTQKRTKSKKKMNQIMTI